MSCQVSTLKESPKVSTRTLLHTFTGSSVQIDTSIFINLISNYKFVMFDSHSTGTSQLYVESAASILGKIYSFDLYLNDPDTTTGSNTLNIWISYVNTQMYATRNVAPGSYDYINFTGNNFTNTNWTRQLYGIN